ncbi:MAG: restriction endonuclease subunit S [Candidatus Cloacimonadales bacterium]
MREWKEVKLGDYIKVKHGFAFKGKNIIAEETTNILVTPGNFNIGGGFKKSKLKYYNGEVPQDYILKENAVIVTMTDLSKESDSLGYSAKVPKSINGEKYLHNQRIGLVQFKNDSINYDYIYWVMRTREYQGYIIGSSSGTSIMHTSPSRIEDYAFSIPSPSEQKAIAEVLSSLDDKIDLLHRQNKTLEQMAETLFRQWFIEEADEDWEEGKLGDNVDVLLGGTPSTKNDNYWDGNIPWINSGEINKFRIFHPSKLITELGMKKSSTKLLPKGTTVLAITGATLGQVSRLEISSCANQSVVGVIGNDIFSNEFIFLWIKYSIKDIIANQTGGAQQHINRDDVKNTIVIIPSKDVQSHFQITIEPLFDKITNNVFQIENLENLRDTLLPKLMSGEVRIRYE